MGQIGKTDSFFQDWNINEIIANNQNNSSVPQTPFPSLANKDS